MECNRLCICAECIKNVYYFLTLGKYNEKYVKSTGIISYFPMFTYYTECIIIGIRLVFFSGGDLK